MKKTGFLAITLMLLILLSSSAWAQEEGDDGEIGSFTIAPKLGWAYFVAGNGHGGANSVGARNAMNVQFNLDFGGAGSAFELAPYYTYQTPGPWHTVGLFLGGVYRFNTLEGTLYPSVGGGIKLGYLIADGVDYGIEMIARIPVGVTYYVLPDLGIVAELGLGWAAVLYKSPGLSFGASEGFYCDLMVGIRWP